MKCDQVQLSLDDFVDGQLSRAEAASIEDHLRGCELCSSQLAALRELRSRTASLASSIEPARDLWPEIADRIESRKLVAGRFRHPLRSAVIAAAAAAVLVGAVIVGYLAGRQNGRSTVVEATPTVDVQWASYPVRSIAELREEFERARSELLAALESRRPSLSPEALEVVDSNLRLIDDAIEEITAALAEDPDNIRLGDRLAAAYRHQIDLLQRANRLPAET
jgi:anti-sigma factor RsiW